MPIDDRSPNRSYQLPAAGNLLADDVSRLRAALNAIDADVFARYTKTEVDTLINNLIQGAPGALNTLDELAAALGDDANFAATMTNALALKANIADVYSKSEADARYVQGQVQTEMVFIATANQSVFTLTTAVINKPSALVTIDGVVQPSSEYSLNQPGTQLTLSEGVPAGTVVRVLALGVSSQGAPADDTVTTAKLRDAAVTPSKLAQPFTTANAQTASSTNIDFTGIPSWTKRVTVTFIDVSTSGNDPVQIRLGTANGIESSGYNSSTSAITPAGVPFSGLFPNGFTSIGIAAGEYRHGSLVISKVTGNIWVAAGNFLATGVTVNNGTSGTIQGSKVLSGVLDRLRITTLNGVDILDNGTINIFYE